MQRWSIQRSGIVGLAALVAVGCGSHDEALDDYLAGRDSPPPVEIATDDGTASAPDPGVDPDTATDTTTTSAVPPATVEIGGPAGDRGEPFAFDAVAAIRLDTFGDADGSVWNVTVSAPTDVTAAVLARNSFNDPPPEGVVFAGFEATMTLAAAAKEPLAPAFNLTWEILGGATATAYDSGTIETDNFGCGVTPNDFGNFSEVYVGGTVSGLVCIPLPADDLGHPDTTVAIRHLSDTRNVFAGSGTPGVAAPIPEPPDDINSGSGDGTREAPHRYGETVSITLDTFGDADGSVWEVEIAAPDDMTDAVLAANPFNDPPPDGVAFVGFAVRMRLVEAGKEPLAPAFNFTWEILGGSSRAAYRAGTIETTNFGCGVAPQAFETFTEVFVDGIVEGIVCVPVPVADLGHPSTQVAIHHSADTRSVFGQAA